MDQEKENPGRCERPGEGRSILTGSSPTPASQQSPTIQPIETLYKGFRFRSRLEARWAVFFDAAGIEWQYEPEGYNLNGRWYLPDFWLPRFKTFVEVKPTEETAQAAKPIMELLLKATGHRGLLTTRAPDVNGRWTSLSQCPFCGRMVVGSYTCDCTPDISFRKRPPNVNGTLLRYAMGEAQRARFEHGETGVPRPYVAPAVTKKVKVYVAGAVVGLENDYPICLEDPDYSYGGQGSNIFLRWRGEIFPTGNHGDIDPADGPCSGRFVYGGPLINSYNHGDAEGIIHGDDEINGLADRCLKQVRISETFFAWIDRENTVGTLIEIGSARTMGKPIFIAFKNEFLANHFYFAAQLANVAVVAPSASVAWKLFVKWRDFADREVRP